MEIDVHLDRLVEGPDGLKSRGFFALEVGFGNVEERRNDESDSSLVWVNFSGNGGSLVEKSFGVGYDQDPTIIADDEGLKKLIDFSGGFILPSIEDI